jgi:catechol 2,3-dioxygenase-like lactoylglutathione lyase family enzyme
MAIKSLHHVQLAMPAGREDEARAFYIVALGFVEVPKPENLARRGGVWFRAGSVELHLGVEDDFRPAKKAHPAFLVEDLASIVSACVEAGYPPKRDEPLPGFDRVYVTDPFGNRLEILQANGAQPN